MAKKVKNEITWAFIICSYFSTGQGFVVSDGITGQKKGQMTHETFWPSIAHQNKTFLFYEPTFLSLEI